MVAVNCAYDEMVPIHKLVRNPRNPNTHPPEQLRLLEKIIDYQGWRNPIVVSNRSGFIVKGHARLTVAEMLGLEEVPVDFQDYETEAQEWADLLADNRIAELAEMGRPELKDLLQELDTGVLDMELTGYTEQAIEDLMTEFHVPNYSDLEKQNQELTGEEDTVITIVVPAKYVKEITEWLRNGEGLTGPQLGKGVMKRCGLL
tara:strand:+ start:413 stop:1018 length:606 start_codon:yes stop_codon:yes gene_type:complete